MLWVQKLHGANVVSNPQVVLRSLGLLIVRFMYVCVVNTSSMSFLYEVTR